ncbi:unnamed protein product [Bursaphelenchus okinawaensis]|uniref:Uncharacterized protein n=1 Tax=Bursaphelenchus okinawaensis TaxID=465554 RepID=A0A811K969_9BILA|nr:unnamed protein product [Bursaphelenchus okinawaensis]CAG9097331.1 unnamed protein product [Bursaphelenchus okinawaensis]
MPTPTTHAPVSTTAGCKREDLDVMAFIIFVLLIVYSAVIVLAVLIYAVMFRHHFIWLCRDTAVKSKKGKKSDTTAADSQMSVTKTAA